MGALYDDQKVKTCISVSSTIPFLNSSDLNFDMISLNAQGLRDYIKHAKSLLL